MAFRHHPQGGLAFRVEAETGVFVYASDHERGVAKYDEALAKLAHGADLMLADSNSEKGVATFGTTVVFDGPTTKLQEEFVGGLRR